MYEHDDADALHAAPSRVPTPDGSAPDVSRAADPGSTDARSMLELQRLAGNASVSRLLAREPSAEAQLESDAGAGGPGRSPILDVVGQGGGETLQPDLRAEMEGRLGADFGDVRIHHDAAASDSARSVGAHAYTVGSDVVFRSDRWDPSSSEGKRTLAHELTHVIQQSAGPVEGAPAPGGIRVSSPDDAFEQAADRRADAALTTVPYAGQGAGGSTLPTAGPSAQLDDAVQGAWIQRQDDQDDEEEAVQGAWLQRQDEDELPEEAEAAQAGPQATAESAASEVGSEAAGSSQAPAAGESAATNAAAQAAGANQAPVAGESAATNAAADAVTAAQAPAAEDALEEATGAAAGVVEGAAPPEEAEDEEGG